MGGQVRFYHFPIGHFSVAMRSFTWVEQPHLRQRPVPLNPSGSHKSQELHEASRSFNWSSVTRANPFCAQLIPAFSRDRACSVRSGNGSPTEDRAAIISDCRWTCCSIKLCFSSSENFLILVLICYTRFRTTDTNLDHSKWCFSYASLISIPLATSSRQSIT